MLVSRDIGRQGLLDPPTARLGVGTPHQTVDGRVRSAQQLVEQEGAQESRGPGKENPLRLGRTLDRQTVQADVGVEDGVCCQVRDRSHEPIDYVRPSWISGYRGGGLPRLLLE